MQVLDAVGFRVTRVVSTECNRFLELGFAAESSEAESLDIGRVLVVGVSAIKISVL